MKKHIVKKAMKFSSVICATALLASVMFMNACNKRTDITHNPVAGEALKQVTAVPLIQHEPITSVVTVVNEYTAADGTTIHAIFHPLQEVFSVHDPVVIATLKSALDKQQAVTITFDPWGAIVTKASIASSNDQAYLSAKKIISSPGTLRTFDLRTVSRDVIDQVSELGAINLTTDTLTNVIPDFATAQLMFDYIAHQCCQLPGPYAIDHCISFQYCPDGCYARAHKMCMIINSKYHYGTQKVFSFGTPSPYELSVKAEKWGGCCINWWYHVAPLVTIKTTTGPKAYVFDPAMFDQPVLLSTWLHAQQNPDCATGGGIGRVTSINIQPTSSYSPYSTTVFDTDPIYYDTNSTLVSYRYLISCP